MSKRILFRVALEIFQRSAAEAGKLMRHPQPSPFASADVTHRYHLNSKCPANCKPLGLSSQPNQNHKLPSTRHSSQIANASQVTLLPQACPPPHKKNVKGLSAAGLEGGWADILWTSVLGSKGNFPIVRRIWLHVFIPHCTDTGI